MVNLSLVYLLFGGLHGCTVKFLLYLSGKGVSNTFRGYKGHLETIYCIHCGGKRLIEDLVDIDHAVAIIIQKPESSSDRFNLFFCYALKEEPVVIKGDTGAGNGYYGSGFWIEVAEVQ